MQKQNGGTFPSDEKDTHGILPKRGGGKRSSEVIITMEELKRETLCMTFLPGRKSPELVVLNR
jgi:hypothetical protein